MQQIGVPNKPALTLAEAGDVATLSQQTIRKLIKEKQIEAVKVGRQWRIPTKQFLKWLGVED